MGWSTEGNSIRDAASLAGIAFVLLATQGCVTGHLMDAARRIERPITYREASVDGERLVVRYAALVTDDNGRPLGRTARRAAIALADLRRDVPVERFPVRFLSDDGPLPGRPLPLVTGDGAGGPSLDVEESPPGQPFRLVLEEGAGDPPGAFYSAALTRRRTAAWAYPLVPFTLAVDAVGDPILLFFAPAVIVFAD